MSKIKYHYNTRTLQYERYVEGWGKKLLRLLYILASGVVFSTIVIFLAYKYLDSPKEKQLKREISNMQLNYDLLDERLDRMEVVLGQMEHRDDDIYRTIFEAEPIPDDIRNAGFGGVNRYEKLNGFEYSDLVKQITQRVDMISKKAVIQSKSYDEIWELIRNQDKMLASIPAMMPVKQQDLKLTASGYGNRIDPIYKTIKFHAAMDYVTDPGKPVYATGNGTVEFAGVDDSGYGIHVVVNHGFGYHTLYGHFSELKCTQGQKVKRGDLIGLVGSTGKSVGPHLHYEVHKNGEPVNPVNYYFSDLTAEEYQRILDASKQPGQAFD